MKRHGPVGSNSALDKQKDKGYDKGPVDYLKARL